MHLTERRVASITALDGDRILSIRETRFFPKRSGQRIGERVSEEFGIDPDPRLHLSVNLNTCISLRRLILVSALLALPCTGCVRRRMMVRTNPPGATVSVDNQVIGTTPAASSFVYYGTREFRIEKDGYRTETIRQRFDPPWYEFPGLDFISETLWPGEIRDERVIDVELVPKTLEPTENVVQRADSLRVQSHAGVVTAPR